MDRHEIAQVLHEMGLMLELTGANAFKVRAYTNAARALEELADDIGALIASGELTAIRGIGKNLAEHIAELHRTGGLAEYDELRGQIPDGVIEMLRIQGLGPKKARAIWKELHVTSVGELEMACRRHMVQALPGFGAKSEAKILSGIEVLKKFADKHLFAEGVAWAELIHDQVKSWPEVMRSEIAGSIRRRREVIKDIDILVATDAPEEVMERFIALASIERVIAHGATKSSVMLEGGINCDLRAVTDAEYPFALHYFTGSKEHNVAMRARAKKYDCKLNEYGLFNGASQSSLACADEAEIFAALELEYIPPELREDRGEIEAASEGALPTLVEQADLKGILHVHTTFTDGTATVAEMAEAARERGYAYIAICDHSQAVTIAGGMKPADVRRQHKEIDALNRKWKGFRVLKGIEVDILADGTLDFDDELLATFDIVIAAVHSRFGMSESEMTERIVRGISNPHVDILAHPTGRLLLAREGYALDLKRVLEAIGRSGKAVEINAHPRRLDLDWRWHRVAIECGAKLVICPDAHAPDGLDDVSFGINVARKGWLKKADLLNSLSVEELLRWKRR